MALHTVVFSKVVVVPDAFEDRRLTKQLSEQIGLSRADLIRETAKKFGYTRLGAVMTSTVEFAVDKAVTGGKIKNNGDKYTL